MTAFPIPTARVAAFHRVLRPLERAWAVVLMSVVSGAYLPLLAGNSGEAAATQLAHVVLLPLYAVLGLVIVTHPNEFVRAALRGKFALALVFLAGLSTLWSIRPGLTLARSISLLAPTALGLMLSSRFTWTELVRLLAIALGVAALVSAVVALALPAEGISSIEYGNAWNGVYGNKNGLVRSMARATAALVLVALDAKRYRWLAWAAAAGTFAILLLAYAAASFVVCVAVLSLIPLFRALRLHSTTAVALWILAVLLAGIVLTLLAANLESTLSLLGRDATLTGRTEIWVSVMASIVERPWLGYGYNAFWQEWSGPSAAVLSAVGWDTPHSHNGVLDLWLDLGAVGIVVFVLGLVAAIRTGVTRARTAEAAADLWPLILLTFLLLINISEAVVLKQHNLFWVLYVAVLASPRATSAERFVSQDGTRARGTASPSGQDMPRVPFGRGQVSPGVRTASRRRDRHG
jgi:O-antigen ligase